MRLPHLRAVDEREHDRDLAVVAHARAIETGLGGAAAMDRAFTAAGVDELRAERDALREDLAAATHELEQLRELRDTVTAAIATRSAA